MVNFRDRWNTPKQAAAAADQPPLPVDQSQGRVTAGPSGLQPAAEGPSAACETSSASLLETIPGRAASPAPAESVLLGCFMFAPLAPLGAGLEKNCMFSSMFGFTGKLFL